MRSAVSVIIPCYRCAETIDRAVASVVMQTWPPQEILLVEDCSDDEGKTIAALLSLQQIYTNQAAIKIIRLNANSGPGGARNAGWQEATQPYLAFLDADDSWHARKLEIQYQWMAAHPHVNMSGHRSMRLGAGKLAPLVQEPVIGRAIGRRALLLANRFPARSVMLRRDGAYRFDPAKRYAEDYLLWLQIVLHGGAAVLLEVTLAYSYKADFGEKGLSGNSWKMEQGELDSYARICQEKLISRTVYLACVSYSLLKYLRRLLLLGFQRASAY